MSIPIPAPTQCAVPIDDHPNTNSPASASSSRSTTRKRPRRAVRQSLPPYEQYDRHPSTCTSMAGPSSAPYDGDGGLLDDLLDQAERLYVEPVLKASRRCRQGSNLPSSSTYSSRKDGSGGQALREQSMKASYTPLTPVSPYKSRTHGETSTLNKMPSMSHHSSEEGMTSTSTMTDESLPLTPRRNERHPVISSSATACVRPHSSPRQVPPPAAPTTHGSHSTHNSGPRIGIRAPKPAIAHPALDNRLNKPFRPPAAQPIRSSPRQHNKVQNPAPRTGTTNYQSQRPVTAVPPDNMSAAQRRRRAAIQQTTDMLATPHVSATDNSNSPRHVKIAAPQPVQVQQQSVPLPRPASPDPTRTKMPSSDGVGNESIDSFDGLLLNESEEWDAVLRAVDGA